MSSPLLLFDSIACPAPPTQGIKYAGSKLKLLPEILRLIRKTGAQKVLDGFSGSTRVSQALASEGYNVICNDKAVWSQILATCFLLGGSKEKFRDLISHLNAVKPTCGWFTENYGGDPSDPLAKKPFQIHNTMKLDGIREEIDSLSLSAIERSVSIASLMLALDQVDSTLGHFASYLRGWSPRSYQNLVLKVPDIIATQGRHEVTRRDILDLTPEIEADLAYFDPPYGSNNEKMPPSRIRYEAYYHFWTSVCLNDKPTLFGKVGRRVDSSDSVTASIFEDFRKDDLGHFVAVKAIDTLLKSSKTKWILLSYSTGGRATFEELIRVIDGIGSLEEIVKIDHRRHVMSSMKWTGEWLRDSVEPNQELLFLIER